MRSPALTCQDESTGKTVQQKPLYLDYLATTPVDPQVLEAMIPYFCEEFGNPSSGTHTYGTKAKNALEKSRKNIATAFNARSVDIIFTSGASESNNMVLKGISSKHIITTNIEHKSVLSTCQFMEEQGVKVTYLPVNKKGLINPQQLCEAIGPETGLVSIMMANNEIGTINPIKELAQICNEKKVLFHTDAAQAAGKIPIDIEDLGVDFLSFSAHKFYGPKGIGGLFVKKELRNRLTPLIHGGGQEWAMRAGTHNIPGIVGMDRALNICIENMADKNTKIYEQRQTILKQLRDEFPEIQVNGDLEQRLAHNLNITIPGVESEDLMIFCRDLAFSASSACSSNNSSPSYVLSAIGLSNEDALCSFRMSLGKATTDQCVKYVCEKLITEIKKLKINQ